MGTLRSSTARLPSRALSFRTPSYAVKALCAGAALAAACAGSSPRSEPQSRARPSAAASASAASPTLPPVAPPKRLALGGAATTEVLDFTVLPVPGRRSALLVAADLREPFAFLRRIDERGQLGALRVVHGRHAALAFDLAKPILLSADGKRLCVESLDAPEAPRCREARADLAVVLGDRLALLELVTEKQDEADKGLPPEASRRRLWVRMVEADGPAADPIDSGLTVVEPFVGMGLVDAVSTPGGARILYFEHRPPRGSGKNKTPRAALRSVAIDRDGKLVDRSLRTLLSGDRRHGFLDGHHQPRLFSQGSRVLYLGRFVDDDGKKRTTGFEALDLSTRKAVSAPAAACIADPWRLLDDATIDPQELAAYERMVALSPALTAHQPATHAARIAWAGDSGYFVKDRALHRVSRDGQDSVMPPPFEAKRARLSAAALHGDGSGLALGSDGMWQVQPDGSLARHPAPVHRALQRQPVRIGSSWWAAATRGGPGAGAAIVRLLPAAVEASALSPLAHADGARLVGGREAGMLVALHGARLAVWSLAADGKSHELAAHPSPIGVGFEAIERPGGGALVVGPTPSNRHALVAFAIDEQGRIGAATPIQLPPPPLRLAAHPGGALAFDEGMRRVVWLDREGRQLARAPWHNDAVESACVDGVPAPRLVPTEPGKLARTPPLEDACMVSLPVWLDDGTVRWLGTRVSGLDSTPELVTLKPVTLKSAPATVAPVAAAPARAPTAAPAAAPCPADMVSIAGRYCIDRFESQLVEAASGLALSPDHATSPHFAAIALEAWSAGRLFTGDLFARSMPLPSLGRALDAAPRPLARSRADVVPSGYVSGLVAAEACRNAKKRLCTPEEWVAACRGEQDRKFPYGDDYQHGVCNVYRYAHPAATLHGNAAIGHLDPRLNRVAENGAPLLRRTGATPRCASRWSDDAVHDMVGNLDEWIDEKGGAFAGAFYSRMSRSGCDASIGAHPKRYLDYSLGVRCCRDSSAP